MDIALGVVVVETLDPVVLYQLNVYVIDVALQTDLLEAATVVVLGT
jgi:hypothetical protein